MGEQELIFDLAEIHLVSVECSHCGHSLIFDVRKVDTDVPNVCPVCRTDFRLIAEGLSRYRKFYHHMPEAGHKVEFRIRVPKEGR
jgi:hypothetical protein